MRPHLLSVICLSFTFQTGAACLLSCRRLWAACPCRRACADTWFPTLLLCHLSLFEQVLSAELPALVGSLSFKKSMRWNAFGAAYSRPLRWLLALHGDTPLAFTYGGLCAGDATRVLRNAAQPELQVRWWRGVFGLHPCSAAAAAENMCRQGGGSINATQEPGIFACSYLWAYGCCSELLMICMAAAGCALWSPGHAAPRYCPQALASLQSGPVCLSCRCRPRLPTCRCCSSRASS